MATEKTPAHKRIKRAESGRDNWKIKALERREEIEQLKQELASKEAKISNLVDLNNQKNEKLTEAEKRIHVLEKENEYIKKKLS
jgi:hypothetical protein